ncbi:MAG: putative phage head-tail adaptor family [Anaerocolumna sp.]|jgi:SPP1 family predicted phage head-tail adaptor|nr:putative phage head-tail adaptor family [Anaerocolumna sp.]
MDVNIGELNKRISIGSMVVTTNENAYEQKQWQDYLSCWSKVSNISGTELFKSGRDFSQTMTRFLIRYRSDKTIDDTMQIKFGKRIVDGQPKDVFYNIKYVNNYNFSNEFLEIIGEVVV